MGEHHFRYALFPHASGPQAGGVIPEAAAFNQPLRLWSTLNAPQAESFFAIDNPAIVLDTVKKAEDSEDLILRFYESHGARQVAKLTTSLNLARVVKTDLLESNGVSFASSRHFIKLVLRPFEILNLRLSTTRL